MNSQAALKQHARLVLSDELGAAYERNDELTATLAKVEHVLRCKPQDDDIDDCLNHIAEVLAEKVVMT